jgi:hypothetical protein
VEPIDDRAPGWTFHIEEASAGVWRLRAQDEEGRTIESTGVDPDAMKQDALDAIARGRQGV